MNLSRRKSDPVTDNIDLAGLHDSGLTQTYDNVSRQHLAGGDKANLEANVILIAHPEGQRLGSRVRLSPGGYVEVGRAPDCHISLPEVPSISRKHARLHHRGPTVTVEDLGSTNGTYVNGKMINQATPLHSGDRFQVAAVHFKFLHERDVEHAYYEAIYDLVTRDGLTEIYNKRKYDEEVARELARAQRYGRPLALILVDLDAFKEVNDQQGHLFGDVVLKEFATLAASMLRPEQTLARVGGDEFVILSPETNREGARTLAEKLRAALAATEIRYADAAVNVTCSCGVAVLTEGMRTPEDLYQAADQALYSSKNAGRDRVSMYDA